MSLQAAGKYLLLEPLKAETGKGLEFKGSGEIPRGRLVSRGGEISYDGGHDIIVGMTIYYKPLTGLVLNNLIAVEWQDVLAYEPPGEVSS